MHLLTALALAAEPPSDPSPPASAEPQHGMRIFIGGGSAVSSDGGTRGTAELGVQRIERTKRLSGAWGLSLQTFDVDGRPLPILDLDAMLRLRPAQDWTVRPFISGGVGLSVLLILPMPCLTLGLGTELNLGDLNLDLVLQARQIADIYVTQDSVTTTTLQVGVGF